MLMLEASLVGFLSGLGWQSDLPPFEATRVPLMLSRDDGAYLAAPFRAIHDIGVLPCWGCFRLNNAKAFLTVPSTQVLLSVEILLSVDSPKNRNPPTSKQQKPESPTSTPKSLTPTLM